MNNEKRMMSDYLCDQQLVRHVEKKNGHTWEGKYNKKMDAIEHESVYYKSPNAFAVAHYKQSRPERKPIANGWIECESLCKIRNIWSQLKKKKSLQEIIERLKLTISDLETREILCGLKSNSNVEKEEEKEQYEKKDFYNISEIGDMSDRQLITVFKTITGKKSLPCSHCHLKTVELERFVKNIRKSCNNKKNAGLFATIQVSKTCDYATEIYTKRNAYYRLLQKETDPKIISKIKLENKYLFEQPRRPKIIRTIK